MELAPILSPRWEKNKERKGFSERRRSMGKDSVGLGLSPGWRKGCEQPWEKMPWPGGYLCQGCLCLRRLVTGSRQGHVFRPHSQPVSSLCNLGESSDHCRESLPRGDPLHKYLYIGALGSIHANIFPYVDYSILTSLEEGTHFEDWGMNRRTEVK